MLGLSEALQHLISKTRTPPISNLPAANQRCQILEKQAHECFSTHVGRRAALLLD